MLENNSLVAALEQQIRSAVESSMSECVGRIIDQLVLDPAWLKRLEISINQNFLRRFDHTLSGIDVNTLISQNIDSCLQRHIPDICQDIKIKGLDSDTTDIKLTIHDQGIDVIGVVDTDNVKVRSDAEVVGTLTVNNLAVRGTINTDNPSWDELATVIATKTLESISGEWSRVLVSQVLDIAKTSGIDFASVKLGDQFLIQDGHLCDSVISSRLQQVGVLKDLTVMGSVRLADFVNISQKRMGINTDQPDMALSIWDEEVTMSLGKISAKKAFVGTSRLQNLSIGVNRTGYIEIDTDGLVTVNRLRVGQYRIGHADQVPGYSGTRGDIVFNSDPRENSPFAWICLGQYRWQPLRSA